MLNNEGYIKYKCNLIVKEPWSFPEFSELNTLRAKLYQQRLVGANAVGLGFGNLSVRIGSSLQFFITGSATGNLPELTLEHYVKVIAYDIANNALTCEGKINASSESLSHAAIYEVDPDVNVIVHIHSANLWNKLLHKLPTTPDEYSYGTPEIANAIKELFVTTDLKRQKVIVMGGHKDGIILFANTIAEAEELVDKLKLL